VSTEGGTMDWFMNLPWIAAIRDYFDNSEPAVSDVEVVAEIPYPMIADLGVMIRFYDPIGFNGYRVTFLLIRASGESVPNDFYYPYFNIERKDLSSWVDLLTPTGAVIETKKLENAILSVSRAGRTLTLSVKSTVEGPQSFSVRLTEEQRAKLVKAMNEKL
jgi:hypothetical protein